MPEASVNGTTLHYSQQGGGEPLILLPFLTADHACFAFQLPAYAEHFCCYAVDLRGSGASPRGNAPCTVPQFADDVAAFMDTLGIGKAHILGYSLGSAVTMRFAAVYPERTLSASMHSSWPATDAYIRTVLEGWKLMASALGNVAETAIKAIFPWCFAPELYAARPEYVEVLADFVRSRPPQSVPDFLAHADAVIAHDELARLGSITAPTQITFGRQDVITSLRFAEPMRRSIPRAELEIFENCSHAPFYEDVEGFNARTLAFLKRHSGRSTASMPVPSVPA